MVSKITSSRLLSLDFFRGITIVLMILVNSPGNQTPFPILAHSAWNGCTLADIVFPFFIFIVGMSSVFTLTKQQKKGGKKAQLFQNIAKRTVTLFLIGLALNAISCHGDFATLRILGVLQRIAICYFFSSCLFLTTRIQTQVITIVSILAVYWLLITQLSLFNSLDANTLNHNVIAYLDTLLMSPQHMYTPTFDPEGLLSTLPAIATVLLGSLLGSFLLSDFSPYKKLAGMITAGLIALLLGSAWNSSFPINKALWTSSYVLWTSGLALLVYACCYGFIEIKQWTRWTTPLRIFGINALPAYIFHVVFLKIQAMIHITLPEDGSIVNLRLYITHTCFHLSNAQLAALLYAVCYTLLCLVMMAVIYRDKSVQDSIHLSATPTGNAP